MLSQAHLITRPLIHLGTRARFRPQAGNITGNIRTSLTGVAVNVGREAGRLGFLSEGFEVRRALDSANSTAQIPGPVNIVKR
jgi:hypothetical protein